MSRMRLARWRENVESGVNTMKTIELDKNKVAVVDDKDYEWLNQWKWFSVFDGYNWYAIRKGKKIFGKQETIPMHRFIVSATRGQLVDHADGNGLNNQRSNLRICTAVQNSQNRKKPVNNTSGYKGVHWHKQRKMYRAKTVLNGKHIDIGYFQDPQQAARAYDDFVKKNFGDFAKLNFPEGQS